MRPNRHTQALINFKTKLFDRIEARDSSLAQQARELKLDWYRITNKADPDTGEEIAEVFIYDEIGGSFGVSADAFAQELSAITAPKISVRINSPGGSLFDSIAIHNAIVHKREEADITTYVDSLAASGASIIAMAGEEVVMLPGSQLMIHDALGHEVGNARDFRIMADFLDQQSGGIADMYAAKAGGSRDEWRERMQAETWMFAEEAIKIGLADRQFIPPAEDEEEELSAEPIINGTELDLSMLMTRKHELANRGFKYPGREKAPSPLPTDAHVTALANAFKPLLSRKVR